MFPFVLFVLFETFLNYLYFWLHLGLHCCVWASLCSGFSCCGAQVLGHMGFRSCGSRTSMQMQLAQYTGLAAVHHLGTGTKPVSPPLQGGFLTTGPPGKPLFVLCSWDLSLVKYFYIHGLKNAIYITDKERDISFI